MHGGLVEFRTSRNPDAWLVMLVKPERVCKGPADLRPIGLSHPVGKAFLRALRQNILPYAEQYMAHTPQWGFLHGREASDALAKAFSHCETVRALCRPRTLNINRRRAGDKREKLVGGIAIALIFHGRSILSPTKKLTLLFKLRMFLTNFASWCSSGLQALSTTCRETMVPLPLMYAGE